MGWIMGPLSIVGTKANGAALVLFEGSPDTPDLDRLWRLAERHRVTMLGVTPTPSAPSGPMPLPESRALICRRCTWWARRASRGTPTPTTGWPRTSSAGRVPIINFSGGTEVGGSFLAPYPVESIRSCSLGGPSLGMDVDVVDADARPVRGRVGELACRSPGPP